MSEVPYYILAIALALLLAELILIAMVSHRRMRIVRDFQAHRFQSHLELHKRTGHVA